MRENVVETMTAVRAAETEIPSWAWGGSDEEMEGAGGGGTQAALGDQALVVIDPHGSIRHCTARAGALLARPPETLQGRLVTELLPGLPLRRHTPGYNLAYLMMTFAQGAWHQGRALTGDGRQLQVELSLMVVNLGKHFGVLVSLRQPPPEVQLRNHLERLIADLAASPDTAVVTNPAGVIEYVNPAYEKLTGFGLGDAVGQTSGIIKSGHHTPAFYRAMWDALLAGHSHRAVFTNRARDGQLFRLDQVLRPFVDRRGRTTHYVATGREISFQGIRQPDLSVI